jgi:hypothetical protein
MTIDASASRSPAGAPLTARLVTCSYSGDFELCKMLCESVDRFAPPSIGHSLFVPERDRKLFAPLATRNRTIDAQESLLPRWMWKVPLPAPRWRALFRLPRRNVYLTPFSAPVRGWIAQQIMKISAAASAASDIVVHLDSDNVFIRPLSIDRLERQGRVRLYRNPNRVELSTHRVWHRAAGALLGLPPSDFYGAEYIDQLVVWRRSVAKALVARIEEVGGRDWRTTLARTPHFAEYILYGIFADRVLGLEAAGLYAEPQSLCHSRWEGAFHGAADEDAFVAALRPQHVSCLVQSSIALAIPDRRRLFERLTAIAREQDAADGSARVSLG